MVLHVLLNRSSRHRALASILGCLALAWLLPTTAFACSAPFEEPTIRALGPGQVVVVGTIGERVPGGRLFHVERWFNGGVPMTPIVIAFKEGEPVGDCSYPVATGERLVIAPYREADGRLSADLGTLQADPDSDIGRKYVAEASGLFGPGVIPQPLPEAPEETSRIPDVVVLGAGAAIVVVLLLAASMVLVRRSR